MATVFMKWLETSLKDYDRGIHLLTLGKIRTIKELIIRDFVKENMKVLEIGCGTGTLSTMMARKGTKVTAIDASTAMLAEAKKKISAENLEDRVTLEYMDATLIGEAFQTLVTTTGQTAEVLTAQLYMANNVGIAWYIMGAVGIVAAAGMYVYGRWTYQLKE